MAALFAALICVSTMLVQIPIPATGGYANLGDVLAGYVAFVPGTLLIKAGVALIAGCIFRRNAKPNAAGPELMYMAAACIAAETFMVLGYFFYEAVLLGVGMAQQAASLPVQRRLCSGDLMRSEYWWMAKDDQAGLIIVGEMIKDLTGV